MIYFDGPTKPWYGRKTTKRQRRQRYIDDARRSLDTSRMIWNREHRQQDSIWRDIVLDDQNHYNEVRR